MSTMDVESELTAALRSRGNRVTGPRLRVWEVLRDADEHLTADEIARRVHALDSAVNLSSVYRSLALFSDLDMVRESVLIGEEAARWEVAHPDEHFHLVCRNCGKVDHHRGTLVDEIRNHLTEGHGFTTEHVDLVVSGLCVNCSESA